MRHVLHLMQPARPGGRGGDEGGPTGPCAFPATDGSADLRLPPRRSAIIALPQFRFFGRNAQIAVMSGRIWTPPDCKRVWQTLVQGSQLLTYIRLPYAA